MVEMLLFIASFVADLAFKLVLFIVVNTFLKLYTMKRGKKNTDASNIHCVPSNEGLTSITAFF